MNYAGSYGVDASVTGVDMARVVAYVRRAIESAYDVESPAMLARKGIDVIEGRAEFVDRRAPCASALVSSTQNAS